MINQTATLSFYGTVTETANRAPSDSSDTLSYIIRDTQLSAEPISTNTHKLVAMVASVLRSKPADRSSSVIQVCERSQ